MSSHPSLEVFAEDFVQRVITEAEGDEEGLWREDVFTRNMAEILVEHGQLDDATYCRGERPDLKVDGYCFGNDDTTIDLLVAHCVWKPLQKIATTDLKLTAESARNFLSQALNGRYLRMEESTPTFDLAQRIHDSRSELAQARIIVLTDGVAKEGTLPDEEFQGLHIVYQVWDIERAWRCVTSGGGREAITIDFEQFGGQVPCLAREDTRGVYTSYLATIPGSTLAGIYEKFGTRLLEKNVRAFLQVRGKVNKGLRQSILEQPNMFLTYNNGISATAQSVGTKRVKGRLELISAKDFQIVNGGQTTASLFHARRKEGTDLSEIHVPMKLTVLHKASDMDQVVPLISRYANTQNKVNLADFHSNDPYHLAVEALSRTVWAPDPAGGKRQTHWFYERARGQYLDEKQRAGTPAHQRAFEAINPSSQLFTKTDLAKFENTWNQFPYLVSRGAQKNFLEFSMVIQKRGGYQPEQRYFEDLVAKAILFRQAEKIVGALKLGAYRANIVTYSLALISHLSQDRVDLNQVWGQQALSRAMRDDIERLAVIVHSEITSPPGGQNITEWCKKVECWESLKAKGLHLSEQTTQKLVSLDRQVAQRVPTSGILGNDPQDQALVNEARKVGFAVFLESSRWAAVTKNLEPWQRGILYSVGDRLRRGRDPSRKQVVQALKALEEARRKGFQIELVQRGAPSEEET